MEIARAGNIKIENVSMDIARVGIVGLEIGRVESVRIVVSMKNARVESVRIVIGRVGRVRIVVSMEIASVESGN